jgi:hypothetical protein
MKARTFFEAIGRSCRSRGFDWSATKRIAGGSGSVLAFYGLPKFAQQAVARGHLLQPACVSNCVVITRCRFKVINGLPIWVADADGSGSR